MTTFNDEDYFRLRITPLIQDEENLHELEAKIKKYFTNNKYVAVVCCRELSERDKIHYHLGFHCGDKKEQVRDNFRKHFHHDIAPKTGYSFSEDRCLSPQRYRRYCAKGNGPKEAPVILMWQALLDEPSITELHETFWKENEHYRAKTVWEKVRLLAARPTCSMDEMVSSCLQLHCDNNMPVDTYRMKAKLKSIWCSRDADYFRKTKDELMFLMES